MLPNRRHVLMISASAFAAAGLGLRVAPASAEAVDAEALIAEFTGGTVPEAGRVRLEIAEVAENGANVPVSVKVESAMQGDDRVESVLLVAGGNPRPHVAQFNFSPKSGSASATTRIRLARSQKLHAVARMSDGRFFVDSASVEVQVGGCAG
jgi:sulfur-oxidizing protein SoxY